MHILTKILVVFASVLAVLLSALTISYAVNSDTVVKAWKEEKANSMGLLAQVNSTSSELADKSSRNQGELMKLQNAAAAKDNELNDLRGELAEVRSRVQATITEKDLLGNRLNELVSSQANLTKINEAMRDETTQLRTKIADATKKEVQLLDRIADIESQNEVKEGEIRALREQIAELRVTSGNPSGRGPGAEGAAGVVPPPAVPVRGKVLEVRSDRASGQLLAMVNVGTNDQIKENMVLMIYRSNEFLANLHVSRVDLQSAIGRIDTLNRNVSIRAGDEITTVLR